VVKVSTDKVSKEEDVIVRRGSEASKFAKMFCSKTIDSD